MSAIDAEITHIYNFEHFYKDAPAIIDESESEQTPLIERRRTQENIHALNPEEAMFHLVKGLTGTGLLSLPLAFSNSGLWTGLGLIFVICFINLYGMHQVIKSATYFCNQKKLASLDYANVMRASLENGPSFLRRFAYTGKVVVNSEIFLTSFGNCCVYFLFMADNLQQFFYQTTEFHLPVSVWMVIVLPFVIALCCVRHLKHLAPFSLVANITYFIAIIITLQYLFRDSPPSSRLPAFNSWTTLPLYFGTVMFSVEGVTYILPIENRMSHPRFFTEWNGVLNSGFIFSMAIYSAVGFFGYLKFGSQVEDSITLNLPQEYWYYQLVKLMFTLAIFVTFSVQFYIPLERIEKWVGRKVFVGHAQKQITLIYGIRLFLILLTFALAQLIPHLGLFISLIGSFCTATLALVFPPFIDILTLYGKEKKVTVISCLKNGAICAFGLVGFISGSYSAIVEIVKTFK